ncbi:MAG: hypothetical protein NT165_03980 [Candidatus Falkowbacteria bacterium]|nr:hypothetical protein [Candidatus Falkowbacteria bacterium]
MSLEITHIRFALDLQNDYQIKDLADYLAGAIYPDSRYVSGVSRLLTHDDKFLLPSFAVDDFSMGWQTHQLCDLVYDVVRRKLFEDLFPPGRDPYDEESWIKSTAIKIIQDIDDGRSLDDNLCLDFLENPRNPNGEDIRGIKQYQQIMIDVFENKKKNSVTEYFNMWLSMGVKKDLCEQILLQAEEFLADKNMFARIQKIYGEMLRTYPEILEKAISGE